MIGSRWLANGCGAVRRICVARWVSLDFSRMTTRQLVNDHVNPVRHGSEDGLLYGKRPAIKSPEGSLAWSEFGEGVARVAAVLRGQGLERGSSAAADGWASNHGRGISFSVSGRIVPR